MEITSKSYLSLKASTLWLPPQGWRTSYEMIAAAMKMKQLGKAEKSLFVVPNYLTEQWASDFLKLYPGANILVASDRDFDRDRRKIFCSRIATGDYDGVIIGHSQFEKIPVSEERQAQSIKQ